jgi:chromosome segregation ATPase
MRTPPEAYLIFKEELKKAEIEKEKLKSQYEARLEEMRKELSFLKEQISSQQDMMKTTVDYAGKLEEELSSLKEQIKDDRSNSNKSYH